MIDPAHPFARATWDLLMVIHDRQLPPPLSVHWSQYSQSLSVQVDPPHFLRYLDALTDAERSVSTRGHHRHYSASGALRGAPQTQVALTAVSRLAAVA